MGKPENVKDYSHYKVGDIDVYVKSNVIAKNDKLIIKYAKILWTEKLTVEGMIY